MQFYALDQKGQAISARQAQKHCNYLCIECGTRVRVRGGVHRQRHFYHLEAVRSCSLRQKGMEHLQLQDYLFHLLPENDCRLEQRFPSISRIADVVWLSQKIVFEIQCSPISAMEINQRNQDYLQEGWRVVWILHDQRYNQKYLTPAELALQGHPHYFSNMNADGEGMIYDQFEILDKGKRQEKLGGLKVDLSAPFTISSGIGRLQSASVEDRSSEIAGAIPSSRSSISAAFRSAASFDEIVKEADLRQPKWINTDSQIKTALNLYRRRLVDWPIYFSGDLIDLQDAEYLQAAARLENEFRSLTTRRSVNQWMSWGLQCLILHPYRVVFRYLLEKACR